MLALQRNPDKLDAKAIQYEQAGKSAKAVKYREKAMKIRQHKAQQAGTTTAPIATTTPIGSTAYPGTTTTTSNSSGGLPFMQRTPARYEQNALKWEQRANWNKAQKNREKVWRLQNPQYANAGAPQFYENGRFLGYNVPYALNAPLAGTTQPVLNRGIQTTGFAQQTVLPAVVETHVHNTIIEQTTRPERIVEVQPVIHREIDAPQVRVVEKHVYETVPSAGPHTVTNAPIIQETVRPKIIEEVQPVVHRNVPAPFVERVEQHVTEHISQPVVMTKEVQQGGVVQPNTFTPAGGLQQTTTTTTTTTQQGGLMGKVNNALHR